MEKTMSAKQLLFFKATLITLIIILLASCARSLTPGEAASGRYKKCRSVG
jgi:hypothetical protein